MRTFTEKLLTYALGRGSNTTTCRRCGRSCGLARIGLSLVVADSGGREERAVSDADAPNEAPERPARRPPANTK